MPCDYEVELTEEAAKIYESLYLDAAKCLDKGDVSNSKVKNFKMIDEAVRKIIPHDPFDRSRALSGPLSNIFRVKKGRFRICYIGSSAQRRILVLYISETLRKEGDLADPYALFTRLVLSGKFDHFFERLGVRRPVRGQSGASPAIH